jgi:hypothetical protein
MINCETKNARLISSLQISLPDLENTSSSRLNVELPVSVGHIETYAGTLTLGYLKFNHGFTFFYL